MESGSVSRILCPEGLRPFIWDRCYQRPQAPYPRAWAGHPSGTASHVVGLRLMVPTPSYAGLLRAGFGQPPRHRDAGGLLPHHFTLTRIRKPQPLPFGRGRGLRTCSRSCPWRYGFCSTFRRVAPPGISPALCPVESGLSSPRHGRGAAARPTLHLIIPHFRVVVTPSAADTVGCQARAGSVIASRGATVLATQLGGDGGLSGTRKLRTAL